MKAIEMDDYGGPEVLHLRDIADPVAGADEIVVDIFAASVNPVDWKVCAGYRREALRLQFPHILGLDFSGVVREVGAGVSDFAPGDEVYGVCEQSAKGAYAEAIAIKTANVAKKPGSLSHAEAAAIALVGLTALVSLEDVAKLASGETALIHAAAGGVGGFAVQYAKHAGARVYATASGHNHDYVRGLGADEVIDYTTADFTAAVPPCDVVYDTVGGDVHARSFSVLKSGGRLVYITRPPDGFEAPRDDVEVLRPQVPRDRRHLERISELVAAGAIWAPEITRMPLAEVAAAHELSKTGHVRGKIVLELR